MVEKRSFEEFKLYYESTEKVTDRRLDANRWNYSICVAILVTIAAITKWTFSSIIAVWVGLTAIAVLAIMAFAFCLLWIGQIRDFKRLNTAKFDVLNAMAADIEFDTAHPGTLVSYQPFDKEWKRLGELNALGEVENTNIIALKSSNTEYFIPKAFASIFAGIVMALLLVSIANWPPTRLVAAFQPPPSTTTSIITTTPPQSTTSTATSSPTPSTQTQGAKAEGQ